MTMENSRPTNVIPISGKPPIPRNKDYRLGLALIFGSSAVFWGGVGYGLSKVPWGRLSEKIANISIEAPHIFAAAAIGAGLAKSPTMVRLAKDALAHRRERLAQQRAKALEEMGVPVIRPTARNGTPQEPTHTAVVLTFVRPKDGGCGPS